MFRQGKYTKRKEHTPKGVNYFHHFPSNFLIPYGLAKDSPDEDTLSRRLNSRCCEWYNRPGIAMSEMTATVSENLEYLQNSGSAMLRGKVISKTLRNSQSFLKSLERLNTHPKQIPPDTSDVNTTSCQPLYAQTKEKSTPIDVKTMLKAFYDEDSNLPSLMDEFFKIGAAMFTSAIHFKVGKHLLSNPAEYAASLTSSDERSVEFKREGDVKALKKFLSTFVQENVPRRNKPTNTTLLTQLASSEEEEATEKELIETPREKRRKEKEPAKKKRKIQETEEEESSEEEDVEKEVKRKIGEKRKNKETQETEDESSEEEEDPAEETKQKPVVKPAAEEKVKRNTVKKAAQKNRREAKQKDVGKEDAEEKRKEEEVERKTAKKRKHR